MASNLNYKQVANVARRTWDVETYEQRAKDRAVNNKEGSKKRKPKNTFTETGDKRSLIEMEDDTNKEEFVPAAKGAAGPVLSKRAFLKARSKRVDVDSKVGTIEMINPEAAAVTKANVSDEGSVKVRIILTSSNLTWGFAFNSHTYGSIFCFTGWSCQDRCRMAL
jgi:U4/U6.U5 tri-snRNP component SNU23